MFRSLQGRTAAYSMAVYGSSSSRVGLSQEAMASGDFEFIPSPDSDSPSPSLIISPPQPSMRSGDLSAGSGKGMFGTMLKKTGQSAAPFLRSAINIGSKALQSAGQSALQMMNPPESVKRPAADGARFDLEQHLHKMIRQCGNSDLVNLLHDISQQGSAEIAETLGEIIQNEQHELAHLVIIKQGGVNKLDEAGFTLLARAIEQGNENTVAWLLDNGARIAGTPAHPQQARQRATGKSRLQEAAVVVPDNMLCLAARHGFENIVARLLQHRTPADINGVDKHGSGALCNAAYYGYWDLVAYLLEQGADINVPGRYQTTLLHLAVSGGDEEALDFLLAQKNIRLNLRDKTGRTPLAFAATTGKEKLVQKLCKARASANITDEYKRSPLHHAVINGHARIARMLVQDGAFTDLADLSGKTALDYAQESGQHDIIKLLS